MRRRKAPKGTSQIPLGVIGSTSDCSGCVKHAVAAVQDSCSIAPQTKSAKTSVQFSSILIYLGRLLGRLFLRGDQNFALNKAVPNGFEEKKTNPFQVIAH